VIHVNLIATFRIAAGVKTFDLDLASGATILQAVQAITERYPALRPHWLDSSGELHAHVHIFFNGEDVANLATGVETLLAPGDTLDFLPPVAGGRADG
jgi:sulfur-carrier protein